MGTDRKTVEYAFAPRTADVVNNTLTTGPSTLTIDLPESSKVFKSVIAILTFDDIITSTGGTLTRRELRLDFSPGGGAEYAIAATSTMTNSGENLSHYYEYDFTSAFTTEMGSSTSKACQWKVQINQSTGTTLGVRNVCVTLLIDYEFDDTSATQVKTIYFPLKTTVGALATSKPAALTTIPQWSTECPENAKTFKSIFTVIEGNRSHNNSTTDFSVTQTFAHTGDADVTDTTGLYEGALLSDCFFRYVAVPNIVATKDYTYHIHGSVARANHLQAWMGVTYTFTLSGTTGTYNSVKVLGSFCDHADDGTYYAESKAELFIEEPSVTHKAYGAFFNWTRLNTTTTAFNVQIQGSGAVAYTPATTLGCGGQGLMVRNDSALTLARGRNALTAQLNAGNNNGSLNGLSVWWILCYTSGVAAGGLKTHNRTIQHGMRATTTPAGATNLARTLQDSTVTAPSPTEYFASNVGVRFDSWGLYTKKSLYVENAGGTTRQRRICHAESESAGELGRFPCSIKIDDYKAWPADTKRSLDLKANDALIVVTPSTSMGGTGGDQPHGKFVCTYHAITFVATGTVYGAVSGTVTIALHRASDGEKLGETTRSGSGAWSITWYDDTENVYAVVTDNAGRSGKSVAGFAGTTAFNVVLGVPEGIAA